MIEVNRWCSPAKRVCIHSRLTIAGIIISLVVFIGHYGFPEKRLTLYPNGNYRPDLFGVVDAEVGFSSYWLNQESNIWMCDYRAYHSYSCSWNLIWSSDDMASIDLTSYDAMILALEYEGPATRVRLYMRNFNPAYSRVGDPASTKFMSMTIPVTELENSVHVGLDEFQVAHWWLRERHIERQWTLPEFNGIMTVGMDFIEPGTHQARIKKIVLRGRWIDTETLLLVIIGFWMTLFMAGGVVRLYCHYLSRHSARRRMRRLQEKEHDLKVESRDLKLLADLDPLTGAYNRSGMQEQIASLFTSNGVVSGIGLILIDIDNFKQLNDTHGYDTGDRVLKAIAAAISANLRHGDMLARWGADEFVVLREAESGADLLAFSEKLREIIEYYTFGYSIDLTLTVSLGVTMAQTGTGHEKAFKRATRALNRAKNSGKNRVEIEL